MRYGVENKVIFFNNYELRDLTIADGITSIGISAFYNCSGLTSITIPASVTFIGSWAFDGCTELTSITVNENNSICASQDGILYNKAMTKIVHIPNALKGDVVISDGVTSIEPEAFKGRSGLTSIKIPNSVTSIGSATFSGCNSLESMTLPFVNGLFGYIFGTSSYTGGTAISQSISSNSSFITYYVPTSLRSVTITSGDISYGAFSYCSGLTNITIGDNVTYIGSHAFYMCDSLENVIIGDGVTSIYDWAFYGCNSLESITLPFVGYRADSITANYTTAFGYIFGYFSNKSFVGQYNSSNYQYNEGGKYYWYHIPSSLHSVTVTKSDMILDSAFYRCSGLTSITIPDSVTSIGSKAFCGCSGLTIVVISNNVTSIGSNAFGSCNGLISITVAENNVNFKSVDNCLLTKDGTKLILGCKNSIIPNSVTSIDDLVFSGCKGLTSITIPNSVISIGVSAFFNCSELTSVTIGNCVTEIGNNAFSGCSKLEIVYYNGTYEEWNNISIGSSNSLLTNATRYYYSETKPTEEGNYWHYVDGEIVIWTKDN